MIYSAMRPEEITMPAKYERVAQAIRDQIDNGTLRPGDRLPSLEQMKVQYGVSYSTLRSAILVLKAEGLIYGVQGEGMFVAGDPPEHTE